jgi:hypothetical protein
VGSFYYYPIQSQNHHHFHSNNFLTKPAVR